MSREKKIVVWTILTVVFFVLVFLLRSVLAPFVLGVAIAYLLDPVTDKVEARVQSRGGATVLVLGCFFIVATGALVLLFPVLQDQVAALARRIPDMLDAARRALEPVLAQLQVDLSAASGEQLRAAAGTYAGEIAAWLAKVLKGVWSGGLALFNVLSLLIVMPLVAFYLLRDWDVLVAVVDDLLPRRGADAIREQVRLIDSTLAGFLRGQATVCLLLGVFYAVGLTLTGLDSGVLVGLMTGLISFIPYLGMALGLAVGLGLALVQFDALINVVAVAAVFGIGQILEGFVLTPKLVGEKVGLHPVWVLLALMAGGALFGFVGVLIAIPVAAVIGVLIRFAVQGYKAGPLYAGED